MNTLPPRACPTMDGLPAEAIEQVATYFQALSEPTRLQILNLLRQGERNVGELAHACGCTSANVSRHLAVLTHQGFVAREGRGTSVYYRIADASVYQLCDLVCGNLARQYARVASHHALFSDVPARAATVRTRRRPAKHPDRKGDTR